MSIYIPRDGISPDITQTDLLRGVCVKMDFHGYQISISIDDSGLKDRDLLRTNIIVFNHVGNNVTSEFLGGRCEGYDAADIFEIMKNIVAS